MGLLLTLEKWYLLFKILLRNRPGRVRVAFFISAAPPPHTHTPSLLFPSLSTAPASSSYKRKGDLWVFFLLTTPNYNTRKRWEKNQSWSKLLFLPIVFSSPSSQHRCELGFQEQTEAQRSPIMRRQCPKPTLEHTCIQPLLCKKRNLCA